MNTTRKGYADGGPMPAASPIRSHYSSAELAAMKLPGLPTAEKNMRARAAKEGWASRQVSSKGGKGGMRTEYQPPKAVRDAITLYLLNREPIEETAAPAAEPLPAPANDEVSAVAAGAGTAVTVVDLDALSTEQRETHRAIDRLVRFINAFDGATQKALDDLNAHHVAGTMTPQMRWAFDHAWDKPRADRKLTRNTLNKWLKNHKNRGHYAPGKPEKDMRIKHWHGMAVQLRKRPQGSSFTWIHAQIGEQWDAAWGTPPSYWQIERFFHHKFSQIDQLKGRYTGSQLRAQKFFQHRTTEGLEPASLIHADGWNTHFTAPHPVTGEFVTYEVWHFHDVATRYVTTPGIGLTENAEVIAKGLENCIRELGVMVHLQTDSTKVVKGAERFTKAMHSLEERLGFTWIHPKEVGNSQANGIAENFNTSWLDKRSRELATYQNKKSMDDLTFKRVKKITADMVKAANNGDLVLREQKKIEAQRMGKGLVFDSYDQAFEWLLKVHSEFNDKPHRTLKKVSDPATGRMRHQTPREALSEFRANGWKPVELSETEMIESFRPHRQVKVTRETVSPYGGMRYRNADVLGHWNGKDVIVAYDLADYSKVWVKEVSSGNLICEAKFVEASRYGAKSAQQDGEEKRAIASLKRLDKKREKVIARLPGGAVIEQQNDNLIPVVFPEIVREPELVAVEFAPVEQEKEGTWEDTYTMLWAPKQDEDGDTPVNEAAAR